MAGKIEEMKVRVNRIGGSWSMKNMEREMSFLEMVHWMNKNRYTMQWSRNCKDGKRRLHYYKKDCNTWYTVVMDIVK